MERFVEGKKSHFKSLGDVPHGEELFRGGASTCAGCAASAGLKLALKALGRDTVVVNSSGCMTLLCVYPETPLRVSWIHNAIENAAATAAAIKNYFESKKERVNVLVYAGDGATYDIGFGSLSGALERRDKIIYVCYNNEEYGNTGAQWSSATPFGAETKTTPRGRKDPHGSKLFRKDINKIVAAHGVYSATASVAYPLDYLNKLKTVQESGEIGFINLYTPCNVGWEFNSAMMVKVARNAVLSGYWPLYEISREGTLHMNFKPERLMPFKDFLSAQGRYEGLSREDFDKLEKRIISEYHELLKYDGKRFV